MKIEVKNDINDKKYIDLFLKEAVEIPVRLMSMIDEKKVILRLVNNINDIKPIAKLEYYRKNNIDTQPIRGIMSDEELCIAILKDNTDINHIGAILYHELGHFIDSYKNFGEIKSLYDLTYSTNPDFINTYREDLAENWDKIQKDKNIRLKHFIQGSTPEKIVQSAISETFAEIFRYLFNKKDGTKTVEMYFNKSIQFCRKNMNQLHIPLPLPNHY